jgi:hypothetical protein
MTRLVAWADGSSYPKRCEGDKLRFYEVEKRRVLLRGQATGLDPEGFASHCKLEGVWMTSEMNKLESRMVNGSWVALVR